RESETKWFLANWRGRYHWVSCNLRLMPGYLPGSHCAQKCRPRAISIGDPEGRPMVPCGWGEDDFGCSSHTACSGAGKRQRGLRKTRAVHRLDSKGPSGQWWLGTIFEFSTRTV